jgi:hypothetical protein
MTVLERRLRLHDIFMGILGTRGAAESRVYFQPPESLRMKYPCIRYELQGSETQYADDQPYICHRQYRVLVIDEDPDSEYPNKIAKLPLCSPGRPYPAENLNHYPFTLYY